MAGEQIRSQPQLHESGDRETRGELESVSRSDAARRDRPLLGARHLGVGFALIPLIERRCAAGHQPRPEQRVQQRKPGPIAAQMHRAQKSHARAHQYEARDARLG